MIITWRRVRYISLTQVPTEDLLTEIHRRLALAPAAREPVIPPPLRREQVR